MLQLEDLIFCLKQLHYEVLQLHVFPGILCKVRLHKEVGMENIKTLLNQKKPLAQTS